MQPFQYSRAASLSDAAIQMREALGKSPRPSASFLAGGTTLLDLMKLNVMQPERLIDLSPLQEELGHVQASSSGLRLGALAKMADVARHPAVLTDYPVISQSLSLAASAQLRNMATLGGNVLQRTRCAYFRDPSWQACNKRAPGTGCTAIDGSNRSHAVLGTSDHCIATYPGDFAQALMALDASVRLVSARGSRTISFSTLHRPPEAAPHLEHTLRPGEIIAEFIVPSLTWARRSLYLKIRDRQSYEFAVASAAVALDMDGETVRAARIALGGLAAMPWRALAAEEALHDRGLTETTARAAATAAFASARPQSHNRFKVELGKATLVRALLQAKAMEVGR